MGLNSRDIDLSSSIPLNTGPRFQTHLGLSKTKIFRHVPLICSLGIKGQQANLKVSHTFLNAVDVSILNNSF